MDRQTFLAQVREAAMLGRAYRVEAKEIPPQAGYVGGGDDLCHTLATEIVAVGGRADVVDSLDDARQVLIGYLGDLQPRSAICWQHALLEEMQVPNVLDYARIRWHDQPRLAVLPPEQQREIMLAADLGISSASFAVAESGTLVLCSQPGQERMVSLLPKVHVAVVTESQILPDLFDLFQRFAPLSFEEWPSNVALITGPSKTGDIEQKLTTGVHGPGDWRVIIVRGR